MKKKLLLYSDSGFFFLIFCSLLVIINLGYYHMLAFPFRLTILFYAWLLEFVAFGVAYESTKLIVSFIWRENDIPCIKNLKHCPPVALLYVTCDDIDVAILKNIQNQTYPNLHIFILDDSQRKESQLVLDSLPFKIIRRKDRSGYKAGNLNNWLSIYGSQFSYFVVADADSLFPDKFVEQMICYAEHPENSNVALFESLIDGWNSENEFARLQRVGIPLAHRHNLYLNNRLKTTLSAGHNNLYRTPVVMNIGGFNENYLSEDHATTLEILKSREWLCKTVPVISYERLPANLNEFARRQARWAFQTLQLMDMKLSGLSWSMYLKIFMNIYRYLLPVVALLGIILLIFFNVQYHILSTSLPIRQEMVEMILKSNFLLFWILYLFLPSLLHAVSILREGITMREYLRSSLFQRVLFIATIWPVVCRLTTLWSGDRLGFNVTGKVAYPSFLQILEIGWPVFGLSWIALLLVTLNPIFSGLNLIWLIPASLSPFLVHRYQRII